LEHMTSSELPIARFKTTMPVIGMVHAHPKHVNSPSNFWEDFGGSSYHFLKELGMLVLVCQFAF